MDKTAIIIDGSPMSRIHAHIALEKLGYDILGEYPSGKRGLEGLIETEPDLLIMEVLLPDMMASELLGKMKEEELETRVVFYSNIDGTESLMNMEWLNVSKLKKTSNADDLYEQLKALNL